MLEIEIDKMTAEEKLAELYERDKPVYVSADEGYVEIPPDHISGVSMAAADIDLIANLVVERIKKERHDNYNRALERLKVKGLV